MTPSENLVREKTKTVNAGYAKCDEAMREYQRGTLKLQPGCDIEQTIEATMTGQLSAIREAAGAHPNHKPSVPLFLSVRMFRLFVNLFRWDIESIRNRGRCGGGWTATSDSGSVRTTRMVVFVLMTHTMMMREGLGLGCV